MSFFGKLKSKLFKSSAKLEEGLDAIVQDDVAPEEAPAQAPAIESSSAPADETDWVLLLDSEYAQLEQELQLLGLNKKK